MNILENIYYITAIIVSLGVFRGIINLFKISNKHEILLISNNQKKLLKYFYIIKYFIFGCFMYGYLYFCYCIIYNFICIAIYWLMFFGLIYFLDDISTYIFKDKAFLPLYINFTQKFKNEKKIFFGFISTFIALFFYFIERKVNIIFYTISQIVLFSILYGFTSKHYIQIRNKYLNFGDKLFVIYLSPLLIKLLCVLTHSFKNTVFSFNKEAFISFLCNLVHSDYLIYIFGTLLILALCFSINTTNYSFDCWAYIIYKNCVWRISYITNDNYAICIFDNFSIMINVDIIKNNYICVQDRWNYYFNEKEKFKEIIVEK